VGEFNLPVLRRDMPHFSGDGTMSLTVFIAFCVLGLDFLIYVLLQWTYGDKRRAMQKKLAAQRAAMAPAKPRPFVVQTVKPGPVTRERLQRVRARMAGAA
jgi:hypothetical protein